MASTHTQLSPGDYLAKCREGALLRTLMGMALQQPDPDLRHLVRVLEEINRRIDNAK